MRRTQVSRARMQRRPTTAAALVFVFLLHSTARAETLFVNASVTPSSILILKPSSQGIAQAVSSRPLSGALGIQGRVSEADRLSYLVQYTMGYDPKFRLMDSSLIRLGTQFAFFFPDMTHPGLVSKKSFRVFDPFISLSLALAENKTIFLNDLEQQETLKIQNGGLTLGAGVNWKEYAFELLVTGAPLSFSTPTFYQVWMTLSLSYNIPLSFQRPSAPGSF